MKYINTPKLIHITDGNIIRAFILLYSVQLFFNKYKKFRPPVRESHTRRASRGPSDPA